MAAVPFSDGSQLPAPWRADKIAGGYVVRQANGQAIAYVYSRENEAERKAKVLTADERIPWPVGADQGRFDHTLMRAFRNGSLTQYKGGAMRLRNVGLLLLPNS
jgi:hypothetical protein